jgi:hypothetical protein
LELEKRGLGLETKPLLDSLEIAKSKITTAIDAVHNSLVDVAAKDPIREQIDILFEGKIGVAPTDQQALENILLNAEVRYERKIPPGYSDIGKDKNVSDSSFLHAGIEYERKYGDLILWKQLIEKAKETDSKAVLFVTSDTKED